MDTIRLNPFPTVPATGKASLSTNQLRGVSVHGIIFEQGGTTFTKAQISSIRIGAGGKNFTPPLFTGSQMQALNNFDGLANTTNYLIWYFGDPTARTIRGQHLGDLDLSIWPGPLEIDVDIVGATAPTLQCYAIVGAPKKSMGLEYSDGEAATVRALIPTVIQEAAAVARKAEGVGLGSSAGARIRKIGFFHTNLTRVELRKQSIVKYEDVTIALNSAIETDFGRVPQAGLYVLDRIVDGNQGEAEDTVMSDGKTPWNLQLLLTTSAADTIPTYADVHALPSLL